MQIHPFAMAVRADGLHHSIAYDVRVERLTEPLATIARAAMTAGTLQAYRAAHDAWWVSRAQLAAIAGFGRNLADPADPCFVPPEAMLEIAYLPDPITLDALRDTPVQAEYLSAARNTADYLHRLANAQPPQPFDRHVHRANDTSPLRALIDAGKLRTSPSELGWWIASVEAVAHLPTGESFNDPASAWYIDPLDYAGHAAIASLIAAHRQHWPELYDGPLAMDHALPGGPAPFPAYDRDWPWPYAEGLGSFKIRRDAIGSKSAGSADAAAN